MRTSQGCNYEKIFGSRELYSKKGDIIQTAEFYYAMQMCPNKKTRVSL